MKTHRAGIIDLLSKSASRKAWGRFMHANYTSVMPQVVAAWCEELGRDAYMAYYDGPNRLAGGMPDDVDVVFIHAYTTTAQLAYALSAYYRSKGAVTVIGGPHSRSYPDDAANYFDYVVGYCDKALIRDILQDAAPHRPVGQFLTATEQPTHLPGVAQRWKFMTPIMAQAKFATSIPVIGSLGCPYRCSFCRESYVPYQPLDYETLTEDLRFIHAQKVPRSVTAWHDPNFGVRFDDFMGVIEEAVPPGSMTFFAEMSLALLKEEHCQRLARNGFKIIAPGIESWFDMGTKSKTGRQTGMDKVRRVAAHTNMILSYIPYMQANFIFGLDADEGPEPFELTKRYLDLAPGAYPLFSLLTAYGSNAPDNVRYLREGRVVNIPFHFLNQLHAMNVRPRHYGWVELFGYAADLCAYAFSPAALAKRFAATRGLTIRLEQLARGLSSGRDHQQRNFRLLRDRAKDPAVRRFFDGETTELPAFYVEPVRKDLGWLWDWLPDGALYHDPHVRLQSPDAALFQRQARPERAVA